MTARKVLLIAVTLMSNSATVQAEGDTTRQLIVGDAVLSNEGYELLEELTTRFQGRLAGTPGNAESMDYVESRLQQLGIQTHRERFDVAGWRRGVDQVDVVEPARSLRAAALGYVDAHGPIEAGLAYVENTSFDELDADQTRGRIALAARNLRFSHSDYVRLVEEFGMIGVLLTNRVGGGQLLARTANHDGRPAPLPVYSITAEDGDWLHRLLQQADTDPVVRLETTSACVDLSVENLVATIPGRSQQKIVLGGHFDSWDLGQGAMDNGLGIAQLFDTARLLQKHAGTSEHTVEILFFNAEEWGLWGSRAYVEQHDLNDVRVMINLDMVGRPIAINAMGFDELLPPLRTFAAGLGSWALAPAIANKTWLGSDHHPFILHGVPAITFNAPIGDEEVRYYHDMADTFDKIDAEMLGRASAIVALLVHELANDTDTKLKRYDEAETAELFRAAGLETRMRKMDQWPFGEESDTP